MKPWLILVAACTAGFPSGGALAAAPTTIATIELPGLARPLSLTRFGSTVYAGQARSRGAPELHAIDTAIASNPVIRWSAELKGAAIGLASDAAFVYVASNADRAEFVILDAATGAFVATLDLPLEKNPKALRLEGGGRVIVTMSPREEAVVDVSNPSAPHLVESRYTSHRFEKPKIELLGYPSRLRAAVRESRGGTIYWHVLSDEQGSEFRTIERRVVRFSDLNGDGVFRLGCLGDSNTVDRLSVPTVRKDKWCSFLRALVDDPFFEIVQVADIGATASRQLVWDTDRDAYHHLQEILPLEVDAMVLAYGTNDVLQGDAGRIVDAYLAHRQTALRAGVTQFYVMTTPRIGEGTNPKAGRSNVMLRAAFPGSFIESFEGFTFKEHYQDNLHLNTAGQIKRARNAFAVLGLEN